MTTFPRAIRLWGSAWGTTRALPRERPPLGIGSWSQDADAVAVWLEGSAAELAQAEFVAAQIPAAGSFAEPTLVVVLGTAAPELSRWRRLLSPRRLKLERAARCAALLALGYVDIQAQTDAGSDVVWAYSPSLRSDAPLS
jgi:hypothetical protein